MWNHHVFQQRSKQYLDKTGSFPFPIPPKYFLFIYMLYTTDYPYLKKISKKHWLSLSQRVSKNFGCSFFNEVIFFTKPWPSLSQWDYIYIWNIGRPYLQRDFLYMKKYWLSLSLVVLSFSFLTANHHRHHRLATSCISGRSSISVSNSVLLLHILMIMKNFTFKFANLFTTVTITFVFAKFKSTSCTNYATIFSSCAWRLKMVECHIYHLNYPISNPTMFQNSSPSTPSAKIDHLIHSIPCKQLGNMSNPIFVSLFILFYPLY